jgi:hypothetical protein
MARTSLADISSLPDPLLAYNFDLLIPNVPGGGSPRALTLKCMNTNVPGSILEQVLIQLHGAETVSAGRVTFTHTLAATFLETRDMTTRDAIRLWQDFARDVRVNGGNYKAGYATDGMILLYDDTGTTVATINVRNMWPSEMTEFAVDGSNSTAANISVTFNYDSWDQ